MLLEQILTSLNEQNLSIKFRGETEDYHATFLKFATVEEVLRVVSYINLADELTNIPVSFISYNEVIDELVFNTHFYNKTNKQIIWAAKSIESIKWVNIVQNKYILSFPSASRVGKMLNIKLQAIDKIL